MERRSFLIALAGAATLVVETPATGKLLVATQKSNDPDFAKSVVLLIYVDRDAAIGLFVNRGSQGGPVPLGVNTLIDVPPVGVKARRILPGVWLVSDPKFTPKPGVRARTLHGTCGWTMKQLDDEIHAGKWRVTPASADLVFAN